MVEPKDQIGKFKYKKPDPKAKELNFKDKVK
jgi:hypothetical protein